MSNSLYTGKTCYEKHVDIFLMNDLFRINNNVESIKYDKERVECIFYLIEHYSSIGLYRIDEPFNPPEILLQLLLIPNCI